MSITAPIPPLDESISPGQGGHIATHEQIADALNHVHSPADSSVRYAAGWGDDDNDGLSWATAWKSVHRALDEADVLYPGDYNSALQIMVADGTEAESNGAGYGIWLSTNPTNAAEPGWHRYRPHQIIGVGAGRSGAFASRHRVQIVNTGSTTDADARALWLDSSGGTCFEFYAENVALTQWQNGSWLGYDIDGNIPPVAGGVISHTYRNVEFRYANFYSGSCPLTGVWSLKDAGASTGYSFNLWFYDCEVLGGANRRNVQQDVTSDNAFAAIFENVAYVYMMSPTFELGGGVRLLDNNGAGESVDFYMFGSLMEGDFLFDGTCLFKATGFGGLASKFLFIFCDQADMVGQPEGSINTAGSGLGADQVVVISSNIRPTIVGAHTSIGNHNGYSNAVASLLYSRGVGFEQGRVIGSHGAPPRAVGAGAITEVNLAYPDISAYYDNGGIASTVGSSQFRDPFGALGYRVTPAAGAGSGTADRAADLISGGTFANNDYLVWGMFVLQVTEGDYPASPLFQTVGTTGVTVTTTGIQGTPSKAGVWTWISGYSKIGYAGGGDNVGDLRMNLPAKRVGGVVHAVEYSRPVVMYLPTSTGVSLAEIIAMATYLTPTRYGAPAGSWSLLDGMKGLFPAGIGVGNSQAATTPGTVVKKIQVFDANGNSIGYVPVYNAIT